MFSAISCWGYQKRKALTIWVEFLWRWSLLWVLPGFSSLRVSWKASNLLERYFKSYPHLAILLRWYSSEMSAYDVGFKLKFNEKTKIPKLFQWKPIHHDKLTEVMKYTALSIIRYYIECFMMNYSFLLPIFIKIKDFCWNKLDQNTLHLRYVWVFSYNGQNCLPPLNTLIIEEMGPRISVYQHSLYNQRLVRY